MQRSPAATDVPPARWRAPSSPWRLKLVPPHLTPLQLAPGPLRRALPHCGGCPPAASWHHTHWNGGQAHATSPGPLCTAALSLRPRPGRQWGRRGSKWQMSPPSPQWRSKAREAGGGRPACAEHTQGPRSQVLCRSVQGDPLGSSATGSKGSGGRGHYGRRACPLWWPQGARGLASGALPTRVTGAEGGVGGTP